MKVFAHRGASGRLPEMSYAAYLAAIKDRADGFECDVRLTLDQEIACFHDPDTARIAGVKHRVSKSKFHQMQNLVAAISLDQLLTLAIANKKDLLIESKHPVATGGLVERKVLELLKRRSSEFPHLELKSSVCHFLGLQLGDLRNHIRLVPLRNFTHRRSLLLHKSSRCISSS